MGSTFQSNGKLLLTAEYLVIDGACALALPTKQGQSLSVKRITESKIYWKSLDHNDKVWLEAVFQIEDREILVLSNFKDTNPVVNRLLEILNTTKMLNPNFLNENKGFEVQTKLDFPRDWGLGTSSTLINNIAQWAEVDPYDLLNKTFGGSGYDIACAQSNSPITYKIEKDKPVVNSVDFKPLFLNNLYFIYLNKKQNSREGIANYKANRTNIEPAIKDINEITSKMTVCKALGDFEKLIDDHEAIISKVTNQTAVKQLLFQDFEGSIKSLGAWGGDFVMATSVSNPKAYFKNKGYDTVLPYSEIIKQ